MIDAQWKFAVTSAIVEHGAFFTDDPFLAQWYPKPLYPFGASIAGAPLAAIGLKASPPSPELAHFLWCLTNAFIAALIPATLLWAWKRQGIAAATGVKWALVSAFATLIWPTATSSFDQPQHAWLLLVAVLLIDRAANERRIGLAIWSGVVFSAVLHYQPTYVVLGVPIVASVIPWKKTDSFLRQSRIALAFAAGAVPGVLAALWVNHYRFGSIFALGPPSDSPVLGNPIIGLGVLLFSQGKGILFFTPIVLVAMLGFKPLRQRHPRLALLIGSVVSTHLALISSLAFPGGDWCWGPRYLVVTLPLVCLLLPYGALRISKVAVMSLVLLSVTVQILGLTLDHHRFYFERNLRPHFWATDPMYHFRNSQLISRPGELLDPNNPKDFPRFTSAPSPYLTHSPGGPLPGLVSQSRAWVRQYAIFYFPRPWPLWISRLRPDRQFVNVPMLVGLFGLLLGAGGISLFVGLRRDKAEVEPSSSRGHMGGRHLGPIVSDANSGSPKASPRAPSRVRSDQD